MLCPDCRRQVMRGAPFCGSCGSPLGAGAPPLELVLASGERLPLIGDVVIGRAPASTLRLDDPSVSRTHARISAGNGSVRIEDVGSSHGTYVDGARLEHPVALRDGTRIRKTVSWFLMRPLEKVGEHDHEVDEVAWADRTDALSRLRYDSDRRLLTTTLTE